MKIPSQIQKNLIKHRIANSRIHLVPPFYFLHDNITGSFIQIKISIRYPDWYLDFCMHINSQLANFFHGIWYFPRNTPQEVSYQNFPRILILVSTKSNQSRKHLKAYFSLSTAFSLAVTYFCSMLIRQSTAIKFV